MTDIACKTADNTIAFSIKDEGLFLNSLICDDVEFLLDGSVPLPDSYLLHGEKKAFSWKYSSSERNASGFSVLFCDTCVSCAYRINVRCRSDINGPAEISAVLTNGSGEPLRVFLRELILVECSFPSAPVAWSFPKESGVAEGVVWHNEPQTFFKGTGIYRDIMTENNSVLIETTTLQDFNAGGKVPMVYLDAENSGMFVAFEWSSSRIIVNGLSGNKVRVSLDFHENFNTVISAGGDLIIPPIYFGGYKGDIEDGSNLFKRWFFLEKTPRSVRENENEPLTQIDYQLYAATAKKLGIQSIKWDYGWWTDRPTTEAMHEGSWHLRNPEYINNIRREFKAKTLRDYGNAMSQLNMNWTLYALLHDCRSDDGLESDDRLTSVGPNSHPEWFSNRKIGGVCPVADLGNEECAAYIKRKLFALFTNSRAKTWRSDFEPIACCSDKKNRHDADGNDVQYWCSRGFYDIVDYLIESIPGFRYESCSSGGSMKDFATMHRASVINNDDSADWMSLRTTFYDSSYCFPPAQLQSPVNPDTFCPDCEKYYAGKGDKDMGMRSVIMSAVMLGSWCNRVDGETLHHGLEAYYAKYLHLHNEVIKPLMRHGNLYHTLPRPDHIHWDGMQYGCDFIPESGVGGVLFLFKPTDQNEPAVHVTIRGLNPSYIYCADYLERKNQSYSATGEELMKNGLTCLIPEATGSEIVLFRVEGKSSEEERYFF